MADRIIKKCPYQCKLIIDTDMKIPSEIIGGYTSFTDQLSGATGNTNPSKGYNIDIYELYDSTEAAVPDVYYLYAPCIKEACELWDQENNTCGAFASKALFEQLESMGGGSVPKASILINEFMGKEDLDGNNYIYGVDFKISDTDPSKPPMLMAIENSPYWPESISSYSWSWYENTLLS